MLLRIVLEELAACLLLFSKEIALANILLSGRSGTPNSIKAARTFRPGLNSRRWFQAEFRLVALFNIPGSLF